MQDETTRFWSQVQVGSNDECWPWTGRVDNAGYGAFNYRFTKSNAHAYSWMLVNGPLNRRRLIHTCGNRLCCNPKHIFLYSDPQAIEARFWSFVDKRGADECWEWTSYRDQCGYGILSVKGKPMVASRLSYELHYGDIPVGMKVCHKCDSPPCQNPNHLFLGTDADNMADRDRKSRQARGERTNHNVLTEQQVREIKSLPHMTVRELTTRFSVCEATIRDIRAGRHWKHVE